jgi:hypothetical protein
MCGHIHTPDDLFIDGIHYLNDGDWVESCTALVEHADGTFEIVPCETGPYNTGIDAEFFRPANQQGLGETRCA